jgi:hypothetical protein
LFNAILELLQELIVRPIIGIALTVIMLYVVLQYSVPFFSSFKFIG